MKILLLAGALALALAAMAVAPALPTLAALAFVIAALALLAAIAGPGLALAAVAFALAAASPALAQAVVAAPAALPLFTADVILPGVMMFGAVLAPLLAFGLRKVVNRMLDLAEKLCGIHFDAKHRAALNAGIDDAVRVILAHGEPVVAQTIAAHASVGNIGRAAQLVLGLAPSAIAHLGVTTEDVRGLVAARLGDVLGDPSAAATCSTCGAVDPTGCTRQPCGLAAAPGASSGPDLPNPLASLAAGAEGAAALLSGGLLRG